MLKGFLVMISIIIKLPARPSKAVVNVTYLLTSSIIFMMSSLLLPDVFFWLCDIISVVAMASTPRASRWIKQIREGPLILALFKNNDQI